MIPAKEFEGELWIKAADFHMQKKKWVGLTDEELAEISEFHFHGAFSGRDVYEDIETRLKEKNT